MEGGREGDRVGRLLAVPSPVSAGSDHGGSMNQWALPTIAVLLIGYGALSGRLHSTVVTQAMVFVALGLLVGNWALDLVDADAANQYVRLLAEATLGLVLFTDAARV